MYDVTVIGGGPAGLTAQLYSIQKGLKAALIATELGGKTNWRLALPWMTNPIQGGAGVLRGMEMVNYIRSELDWLTYDCLYETVERVRQAENGFVVELKGKDGAAPPPEIATRAVIVATGTRQILLNVPGEQEFFLRGLAYSALSYAPLFQGRTAAIIGEGELAIRSAAELATAAKQVYLLCSHQEMLSIPLGEKLAGRENVKILDGYQVLEIKDDDETSEGFASRLVVKNPAGQVQELEVEGTFIERGLAANSGLVAGLVNLDQAGRIQIDSAGRTNTPGIFAAGDVTHLYGENLLVAMGEGAKAALSAYDYLLSK